MHTYSFNLLLTVIVYHEIVTLPDAITHGLTGAITMNNYEEMGYSSRQDYLDCLADDFGVDVDTVYMLADLLGESEDFDGLVISLEDYSE
jgi:hypothetical protein